MGSEKFIYNGKQSGFVEQAYMCLGNPECHEDFYQKYITIWMSRECNSKCKHCYQKGDSRGKGWSFDQADAVTDLFLNDGYIVHPIVNEWLPQYWDFLKIKKKCGSTEITTNGIIITSRHNEFLPLLHENGITDIKFTIFPVEWHEYITGRKRENVITAIKLSLTAGFRITLNFVVMKETLHLIPSFVEEAYNMGVHEIYFMYYFCIDPKNNMFSQVLTPLDLKKFWNQWEKLNTNPRYTNLTFSNMAAFGPNPIGDNQYKRAAKYKKYCFAGNWEHFSFLYMDPEGRIYPCNMLSGEKYKIGEIYQEDEKWNYRFIQNEWQTLLKNFNRTLCAGTMETNRILKEVRAAQ